MELSDFYLTKELVLSHFGENAQELIFTKYLYPPELGKYYQNPFRIDKSAGCKFYYNKNDTLIFYDFAWGKKYDCFNIVQDLYKCNFSQALRIIYENRQEIQKFEVEKIKRKNFSRLDVKVRNFTKQELEFWYIDGLNISQSLLNEKYIYAVELIYESDYIIEDCKFCFAYIENGLLTQIYKANNKGTNKRRFINKSGFKHSDINILPRNSNTLIITKSKKDVFYLNLLGVEAMYVVNERVVLSQEIIDTLQSEYNNIFTLFDNDRTGKSLAWKYRKLYNIAPLFVNEGKDFTEYLKINGYEKTKQEIEKLKLIYK